MLCVQRRPFPIPCGETARPKGEAVKRGVGFLGLKHQSDLVFSSSDLRIHFPVRRCVGWRRVSKGGVQRSVPLFLGTTCVELHYDGVVNQSSELGREHVYRARSCCQGPTFQSGHYDRFLAMNRGNDLWWSSAESDTRLGV
ncbi:hypothetical protein Bca101_081603 [Brassica carinata]